MQALRAAARRLSALPKQGVAAQQQQVRRMSAGSDYQTEVKEMNKWRIVTIAAIPCCIALAVYDLSHGHPHHEKPPPYPYLHIRTKDFPWGPNGLFETVHEEEEHEAAEE